MAMLICNICRLLTLCLYGKQSKKALNLCLLKTLLIYLVLQYPSSAESSLPIPLSAVRHALTTFPLAIYFLSLIHKQLVLFFLFLLIVEVSMYSSNYFKVSRPIDLMTPQKGLLFEHYINNLYVKYKNYSFDL